MIKKLLCKLFGKEPQPSQPLTPGHYQCIMWVKTAGTDWQQRERTYEVRADETVYAHELASRLMAEVGDDFVVDRVDMRSNG